MLEPSTCTKSVAQCELLVVDDQQAQLKSLQQLLHVSGYPNITLASSGDEAIRIIQNSTPQLILLDLQMPGTNGLDVIAFHHQAGLDSEIIVISGETSFPWVKETMRLGAFDFICKPYKPEELLITIVKALDRFQEKMEILKWRDNTPKDKNDRPVGDLTIGQDVTERKQAEEALRKRQELMNTTRLSKTGGWEWSTVTQTAFWEEKTYQIHGLMPGEIEPGSAEHINRSLACYDPEARPIILEAFQRCVERGEPYDLELPFTNTKGSQLWIRTTAHSVLESGKVVRVIGNIVDITERKQAEELLRESEAKFRAMVETSPLALHQSVGVEQITEYMNPTMVKLFGYTQADIPSVAQWWPLAYPDETYRRQIAEEWTKKVKHAIATQSPIEPMEVVCTCKDGSKKNIVWNYIALGDKNYSCGLDITERKRAEEALQQKNREMEQLVYIVSHDLKSPLVTVKTFMNILRQSLQGGDQQQINENLNYIDKAADKMQQLLDALVQYSRIGTVDAPAQTLSANQSVEDCLATLAGILLQHQVQVSTGDLPHQLHGEPLHFGQIWQNLVENAVKYRGDQAQSHIEIGATQEGQDVVFYVRDNGMGIEPKHSERIFNLFSQLNPGSDGSGLGLALVKKIVSIYKGRIWVESAGEGQGSCFMFTLPRALVKDDMAI